MNIEKIRGAVELLEAVDPLNALRVAERIGEVSAIIRAELEMAHQPGKVLTDEEVDKYAKRYVHPYSTEVARAMRYARDNGYIASAAELTVKSITLIGEQPDPTGDIKVVVKLSDGTELEAIRTCANSIFHMVTIAGITEEHARLTAAINAKAAKQ